MVGYKTILLEYVCPAIGTVLANLTFSAPYRDVQKAVHTGHLGDLNPTPWAFMMGTTFGWTMYSVLKRDFWLYVADAPGFLISIWLNLGAAKLLYQQHHANEIKTSVADYLNKSSRLLFAESKNTSFNKSFRSLSSLTKKYDDIDDLNHNNGNGKKSSDPSKTITLNSSFHQEDGEESVDGENFTTDQAVTVAFASALQNWGQVVWDVTSQSTPAPVRHETLVLIIVFVWLIATTFVTLVDKISTRHKEIFVGILMNMNLVFFYGAPLSTIRTVFQTKSSATIHIPTMVMNTANNFFWAVYGLAVNDPLVYIPVGFSLLLGVSQIVLCLMFPRILSSTSTTKSNGLLEATVKSIDTKENLDLERGAISRLELNDIKTSLDVNGIGNKEGLNSPQGSRQVLDFEGSKKVSFNSSNIGLFSFNILEGQHEQLHPCNNEAESSVHATSDTDKSDNSNNFQDQLEEIIEFYLDDDDDKEEDDDDDDDEDEDQDDDNDEDKDEDDYNNNDNNDNNNNKKQQRQQQ